MSNNEEQYTPELNNVGGDGNCFFYALYQALQNSNLLTKIPTINKDINIDNEQNFSNTFRKYLSTEPNYVVALNQIVDGVCDNTMGIDNFYQPGQGNTGYSDIMYNTFVDKTTNTLKNIDCAKKDKIVDALQKGIATNKEYVGNLEVGIVEEILKRDAGITVYIITKKPIVTKETKSGAIEYTFTYDKGVTTFAGNTTTVQFNPLDNIVLYNQGANHYQWFNMTEPEKTPLTTSSLTGKPKITNVSTGQFKAEYPDGNVYEGQMTNVNLATGDGICEGQGTMTFQNNKNGYEKYVGGWFNGLMSGQGTMDFENSDDGYLKYVGNWLNGEMNGSGNLTFDGTKQLNKYNTERGSILNKITTFLNEKQDAVTSTSTSSNPSSSILEQTLAADKNVQDTSTYTDYFGTATSKFQSKPTNNISERGNPNEEIYDTYEGNFINGKMDTTGNKTKGVLKFQLYNNGTSDIYDAYIGDFKEGKMTGAGLFFVNYNSATNPSKYNPTIGSENSAKYTYAAPASAALASTVSQNQPILNFVDGYPEYDGTFDNRGRRLLGILRFPNDNVYIGPFVNGEISGKGILMYGYESTPSNSGSGLPIGPVSSSTSITGSPAPGAPAGSITTGTAPGSPPGSNIASNIASGIASNTPPSSPSNTPPSSPKSAAKPVVSISSGPVTTNTGSNIASGIASNTSPSPKSAAKPVVSISSGLATTTSSTAPTPPPKLAPIYKIISDRTFNFIDNRGFNIFYKGLKTDWLPAKIGDTVTTDFNPVGSIKFTTGDAIYCSATLIAKSKNNKKKINPGKKGFVFIESIDKTPITKGGSKYQMKGGAGPEDQAFFFGEFSNNDIVNGQLYFENEDMYSGKFVNGQMQDTNGLMIFENNDRYIGSFKNGKREGKGIMQFFSDLSVDNDYNKYEGNWSDDKMNGYGKLSTMKYDNGTDTLVKIIYEGEFVNDEQACFGACQTKTTGNGRKIFPNGDVYNGDFVNGNIQGTGVVKFFIADFKDGDKVEVNIGGNWKSGTITKTFNTVLLDENKTLQTVNDIKDIRRPITDAVYKFEYTGTVKGNFVTGLQVLPGDPNSIVNKGINTVDKLLNDIPGLGLNVNLNKALNLDLNNANNYINGKGKMVYVNNNNNIVGEYIGDFVNGQREGQGTYLNNLDNTTYEGAWLNNKHSGKGKLTDNKSRKVLYEGEWKNDKRYSTSVDPKLISKMLKINVVTNVPGYQKFKLKANMLDKNLGSQDFTYFYPLKKINKSFIDNRPKSLWAKQFFDEGLFRSLVMDSGSYYPKSLKEAKDAGYIDSNIKTTLDYLFYTGRTLNLGGQPFVIAGYIWEPGTWNMDLKVDKEDINQQLDIRRYANNPRLQYQLLKKEIENGKTLLDESDESLMQGQNYTGPKSDASQLLQQLGRINLNNIGTGIKEKEEEEPTTTNAPTSLNTPISLTTSPSLGQITPLTSSALVPVNNTSTSISPTSTTVKEVKQSDETLSLQNFFISGDYSTVEDKQTYYWNIITELLNKPPTDSIILESISQNNFFDRGFDITNKKNYERLVRGDKTLSIDKRGSGTKLLCYDGITTVSNNKPNMVDKMFGLVYDAIEMYNGEQNMENCNLDKSRDRILINKSNSTPYTLQELLNNYKSKYDNTSDNNDTIIYKICSFFLINYEIKIFILNNIEVSQSRGTTKNSLLIEPYDIISDTKGTSTSSSTTPIKPSLYLFLLKTDDNNIFLIKFTFVRIKEPQKKCCNFSIFNVTLKKDTNGDDILIIPPVYMICLFEFSKQINKNNAFYNNVLTKECKEINDKALQIISEKDKTTKSGKKMVPSTAAKRASNFITSLKGIFSVKIITDTFPALAGGSSLIQSGGAFYNTVSSNPAARQQLEFGTSPLSYYVTVYLELEKGKVLTASNLVKAKCDTNYNKLLYDFSRFIGKDFVLPPDYKKLPDSVLNDKRLIEDSKRYPNSSRSQYYNPNSSSRNNYNYNSNNSSSRTNYNNYNNNMRYSRRRGGKKSNKKSRKNKDKNPYDFSS